MFKWLQLFGLTTSKLKQKYEVAPHVIPVVIAHKDKPNNIEACPHCGHTWCHDREEQMI
jgi:hypothetical protein